MINEELRKQLDELDAEFAEAEPVVETQEELLARLEDLEGKEVAVEEEIEESEIEEIPRTGRLILTFDEAYIERDSAGRVVGLIGNGWRKSLGRDKAGRVVSIATETEELIVEDAVEDTKEDEDTVE